MDWLVKTWLKAKFLPYIKNKELGIVGHVPKVTYRKQCNLPTWYNAAPLWAFSIQAPAVRPWHSSNPNSWLQEFHPSQIPLQCHGTQHSNPTRRLQHPSSLVESQSGVGVQSPRSLTCGLSFLGQSQDSLCICHSRRLSRCLPRVCFHQGHILGSMSWRPCSKQQDQQWWHSTCKISQAEWPRRQKVSIKGFEPFSVPPRPIANSRGRVPWHPCQSECHFHSHLRWRFPCSTRDKIVTI